MADTQRTRAILGPSDLLDFVDAGLDELPEEIIEEIASYLHIRDICALRTVNRCTATKASRGVFRTFFTTARLLLTTDTIQKFTQLAKTPNFRYRLENLTITGIVYPRGTSSTASNESCVRPLGNAFTALREVLKPYSLRKLSVELAEMVDGKPSSSRALDANSIPTKPGRPEPNIRQVCNAASLAFQTTLMALQASNLAVETLHLFPNQSECAIACDCIAKVLRMAPPPAFKKVERMSLRLSHHIPSRNVKLDGDTWSQYLVDFENFDMDSDEIAARPDSEELSQQYSKNVASFLQRFPNLENLEIQWHSLHYNSGPLQRQEENFFSHITTDWPFLQQLSLKGLGTDERSLHRFLASHPQLHTLTMTNIYIWDGRWEATFNFLTRADTKLDYLELDHLWEGKDENLLLFSPIGLPEDRKTVRLGANVKSNIEYRHTILPMRRMRAEIRRHRRGTPRFAVV